MTGPHSNGPARWVLTDIEQLVTCAGPLEPGRAPGLDALGTIEGAAVAIEGDRIAWIGEQSALPESWRDVSLHRSAGGAAVVPGLVDCHTHIVFAGDRSGEFALRCRGASYEEIAKSGGGIARTMAATRTADVENLAQGARTRLKTLAEFGVTTVEIKSGYGMDTDTELRMLRAAKKAGEFTHQRIIPTFLGAHIVPPEHKASRTDYVNLILDDMLPRVAAEKLAVYCDAFCETTAFSVDECEAILGRAGDLGLRTRLHTEQLHRTGGTQLAAAMGCDSADHLEWIDDSDIAALRASGTVATLLPGATVFLNQKRWPPARALLDAGVPVAISTDCNPGSCTTENLPLMGTLACVRMGMSPHEALLGMTRFAAQSLALADVGALRVGARADLVVLNSQSYTNMFYHFGVNPVRDVVVAGHWPTSHSH